MKFKKVISGLCAVSLVFAINVTSVTAAEEGIIDSGNTVSENALEEMTEAEIDTGDDKITVEENVEDNTAAEENAEEDIAEIEESPENETSVIGEKEEETASTEDVVEEESNVSEENPEKGTDVPVEDIIDLPDNTDLLPADMSLQQIDTTEGVSESELPELPEMSSIESPETVELQSSVVVPVSLNSGTFMAEINEKGRSADGVTQQFTDYITSADDQKYITFGMTQGQILNVTLSNPANDELNYDLILAKVSEDGVATGLKSSALGTYVNQQTGKTVDEGISYIHTDAEAGAYAVFVVSSSGSSTTESFTLTVSIDEVGSYDGNEPNDSPFEATAVSGNTVNASLHVVNDQDWYAVRVSETGIYSAEAESGTAEIYYAVTRNKMVLAPKFGLFNYHLEAGITYYVKVFSDKTLDQFASADYTLKLEYLTRYETMETAFDYGSWEDSRMMFPDTVPIGQQTAYFKFTIDPEDHAYANLMIDDSDKVFIGVLNSAGKLLQYGSINMPDIPDNGVITRRSGRKYLVADMDGSSIGTVGYIMVLKADRLDLYSDPSLDNRIERGYNTFSFSGTAQNPGGGLSSAITLNLSNNSSIPPYAYVTEIYTEGIISSRVLDVNHWLNPGGAGWIKATSGLIEDGQFRDIDTTYGIIRARQSWQFAYYQTALQRTTMSRVKMKMEWKYDINMTNYESYQ